MPFARAVVYHRSAAQLILEGEVAEGEGAGYVGRVRAWAEASGFGMHTPYEPDLAGAFSAEDGAFVVTLTARDRFWTLSVERR